MSVLILSSPKDVHAQAVNRHLVEMGVPATFWHLDRMPGGDRLSYTLSSSGFQCAIDADKQPDDQLDAGGRIDLTSFQSVWLRRAGSVKVGPMPEQWMEELVECECTRALDAIFRAMRCLWVNPPAAEREALLKLQQLDVARRCGLAIPETLVTNDPESAREFVREHRREVIYKLVDEGSYRFFPSYEVVMGMPTLPVRETDEDHLDQVRLSLHLFQHRIDKVSDIRVTVVGERIFPVEIHSQQGKGKVDWRLDYSVPMLAHKLPDCVEESLVAILKRLGLNFGAFDLCLGRDGKYYFFEVNPAGQWLWMEKQLNLPISLQLARLLAGLEQPLTPPQR